jgi:hypothetical protein
MPSESFSVTPAGNLRSPERPRNARHSYILPKWQCEFAEWLSLQDPEPTNAEQVDYATSLAQKRITLYGLRKLKKKPEWVDYYDKCVFHRLARFKDKIEKKLFQYVEKFDWAMEAAKEAGDYREVARNVLRPVENTVWAKKDGQGGSDPTVTINISEARLSGLEADLPEVEAEEIPDEDDFD